jgi:hypothetical protein
MPVKSAYECKVEYSRDGKCLKKEWSVGAIVPWALVAIAGLIWGGRSIPTSFWQFLK